MEALKSSNATKNELFFTSNLPTGPSEMLNIFCEICFQENHTSGHIKSIECRHLEFLGKSLTRMLVSHVVLVSSHD